METEYPFPWWVDHRQEDNYNCRRSPQGLRGPRSTLGSPNPGVLHQKDEAPESLTLKEKGAYFWESQRAVGNKDSTLDTHKISHAQGLRAEAII